MPYKIVLAPQAVEDLRGLKARVRAAVQAAIEQHLRHEPAKISKSRIKRLRGMSHPQYRLRVDEVRVFFDLTDDTVEILAIVVKSKADAWLREAGETLATPEEESDEENSTE